MAEQGYLFSTVEVRCHQCLNLSAATELQNAKAGIYSSVSLRYFFSPQFIHATETSGP